MKATKFSGRVSLALAVAAILSTSAYAHNNNPAQSGSVSVGAGVSGSATGYQGAVQAGVTNTISGSAVAATRVDGNGFSNQATISTGSGTVTAGGVVTPNGVGTSTSQTTSSHVVSAGQSWGNTQATDANGLIVNGTAGLSQVNVNGVANGQFASQTIGGSLEIGAIVGYNAIGNVAPIVGHGW